MKNNYFVSCPLGVESLLFAELKELGAEEVKETRGGCYCNGDLALGYKLCLWSRIANRVLVILARVQGESIDDLYRELRLFPWSEHFDVEQTFAIQFSGRLQGLRNSQFGVQRSKDAIVDSFMEELDRRPSIDAKFPDVLFNIRAGKGDISIALDLSGESLHRRGYRQRSVTAPLKENLAAALLVRMGWQQSDAKVFVDPCCGSGTLLLEACMMKMDHAPALGRERFGFHGWRKHVKAVWRTLLQEARLRAEKGAEDLQVSFYGSDMSEKAVAAAQANIRCAGFEQCISVDQKALENLDMSEVNTVGSQGVLLTNPPYGERLGEERELQDLYRALGEQLQKNCEGWQAGIFTGNPGLCVFTGIKAKRKYTFDNGGIASQLLIFQVEQDSFISSNRSSGELSEGAKMFANRLKKNLRTLGKWAKQQGHECYRLYDADIPEYAVAVDIYGDRVHIQEYAPPKTVDPGLARKRMRDVRAAIAPTLNVVEENCFYKERRRQKGTEQYNKLSQRGAVERFSASEGPAKFWINLKDYLDSGLFLDHRPLRKIVREAARDLRVLNLFCYTGSLSVNAALGGAKSVTSVDLSRTYLDWAEDNFSLNQLVGPQYQFLRGDCREWLARSPDEFDMILLDPPSFSNSKKMDGTLDIQRDHVELIQSAVARLSRGGVLYFSNNLRSFKLDKDKLTNVVIESITPQTIDKDFQRRSNIHQSWKITKI